jgi:hypothetical protein
MHVQFEMVLLVWTVIVAFILFAREHWKLYTYASVFCLVFG